MSHPAAVQPYHASQAQRGGGGWSKYDLNRVGERHGRTRRKGRGYDELLASAQQLRGQMNDLDKMVDLICELVISIVSIAIVGHFGLPILLGSYFVG